MNRTPTYDDVNLILRLYEMRREPKMREARAWFVQKYKAKTLEEHNALCPPGSEPNAYFRMVTSYWEMAASFITAGVLHQDLFFESGRELLFVWERIRDLVPDFRAMMKSSLVAKNLETVAGAYIRYMEANGGPEAYEAFSKFVRG